jgi:hypothetical protein
MKKPWAVCVTIYIAAAVFAPAAFGADYGLVLGTEGEYTRSLVPEGFSVTGTLSPWVSAVLTGKIDLYASGKMTADYQENRGPPESWFFELERTELNLRPAPGLYLGLGRLRFGDPAGLVAAGLFDGLNGSLKLGLCRLSLGAYYTGLLSKETAKIVLSPGDLERDEKPLDAEGLAGYFASRRVLLALTGEFPDLTSRTSLSAQALAQFDLNGDSEPLNTQYLELRFGAELLDPLYINLGAIGGLVQGPEGVQGTMAAFAGADWEVPGTLTDLLSGEILWTGGRSGEKICAFTPVSGQNGGSVFDGGIGALLRTALSYQARPLSVFSLKAGAVYFIRTDLQTLGDSGLDAASTSRLLGGELYSSLVWAPDPAFRFSAGGGVFFPGLGGAYREGAPVKWKANAGLIVSL